MAEHCCPGLDCLLVNSLPAGVNLPPVYNVLVFKHVVCARGKGERAKGKQEAGFDASSGPVNRSRAPVLATSIHVYNPRADLCIQGSFRSPGLFGLSFTPAS